MFPVLFQIGSFSVPTYGLLIGLGFLVGLTVSVRLARRSGMDGERVTNLGIALLLSAIIGAKLFLILDNWSYYAENPGRLFSMSSLRSGGVFYGGLLTALAVAFYYTRRNLMPWLATAEVLVPGLAFGHAIGRLGCFAAGCCWGRETLLVWGVTFTDPAAHGFTGVPLNVSLHPTQLYEAVGTALIGVVLLWRYMRPHREGTVLGAYLALYSSFRFGVEFFRDEGARTLLIGDWISTTQCVAVGLALVGGWLLIRSPKRLKEVRRARRRKG